MLHRLWLTDDQAALVLAALRSYKYDLQIKFNNALDSMDSEAGENINNCIELLDGITDVLTEDNNNE